MSVRPVPEPSPFTQQYWRAAQQKRLVLPACDSCGHVAFPPGPWCVKCHGSAFTHIEMSGRATLLSFSEVHLDPFGGYANALPYVLAVVKLEEGPQLMTNVVEFTAADLVIGRQMHVVFEQRDDTMVPQFTPSPLQENLAHD